MLLGTDWGCLDYLLLDLPPGTGDIQLTVAQHAALAGALVVTTPSMLSHVDVLKGVRMFEALKVPTLAVVENLAYLPVGEGVEDGLEGSGGGVRGVVYPFGKPGRHLTELAVALPSCDAADLGLRLPVSEALSTANEDGAPLVLQRCLQDKKKWSRSISDAMNISDEERAASNFLLCAADGDDGGISSNNDNNSNSSAITDDAVMGSFFRLADAVIRRVYEEAHATQEAPLVFFDSKLGKVVVRWTEQAGTVATSSSCGGDDTAGVCYSSGETAMRQVLLSPNELRAADPSDGSSREGTLSDDKSCGSGDQTKIMAEPMPSSIDARGNYAVRIVWDDGYEHPFFTYDAVLAIAHRQLMKDRSDARVRADSDEITGDSHM